MGFASPTWRCQRGVELHLDLAAWPLCGQDLGALSSSRLPGIVCSLMANVSTSWTWMAPPVWSSEDSWPSELGAVFHPHTCSHDLFEGAGEIPRYPHLLCGGFELLRHPVAVGGDSVGGSFSDGQGEVVIPRPFFIEVLYSVISNGRVFPNNWYLYPLKNRTL